LLQQGNNTVIAVNDRRELDWFDLQIPEVQQPIWIARSLLHDTTHHEYDILSTDGTRTRYFDFDSSIPDAKAGKNQGNRRGFPETVIHLRLQWGGYESHGNYADVLDGSTHVKTSTLYGYYAVGDPNAGKIALPRSPTKDLGQH